MANVEETSAPHFTVESDGADQCGYPQSNYFLRVQAASSNPNNPGRWFYAYNQGKRKGSYALWCDELEPFGIFNGVSIKDALNAYYQEKNKKRQTEQKTTVQPYKPTNAWQNKVKHSATPVVAPVKPGNLHFQCVQCHQHVGAYHLSKNPHINVKLVSPPPIATPPSYLKKRKAEEETSPQNTLSAIVLEGNNVQAKLLNAIDALTHATQQTAYKQVPYHNDITHIHLGIKETNILLKQLFPLLVTTNDYIKKNIEQSSLLTHGIEENNKLLKQLLETK